MTLISSRLSLTHRVTVQRDANAFVPFGSGGFGSGGFGGAPTDGWGNQLPASWEDHLTDLPCRLWVTSGREQVDATTFAVIEDMRLLVTTDTDVTEQDRLGNVTYRGDVIVAGPVGIQAVLRHADHLELVLVRIA